MHKVEKIFQIIAISLISILVIFLLFYFIALPFYNKNEANTYYEYKIRESWNGIEGSKTIMPAEECIHDCFGKKTTLECTEYNEKYDMCEIQCRGVLCGSCVKEGFLNELRCFQLYSK